MAMGIEWILLIIVLGGMFILNHNLGGLNKKLSTLDEISRQIRLETDLLKKRQKALKEILKGISKHLAKIYHEPECEDPEVLQELIDETVMNVEVEWDVYKD